MKKTAAALCCSLLWLCAFGQLDIPFANSETFWNQKRIIPPDPAGPPITTEYSYFYFTFGTTDSIDGMEYLELYTSIDFDYPTGHYRIDGNKIFYREDYATTWNTNDQHGVYASGEYLLYDFDIQIGDTFQLAPGAAVILDNIDSIQIGTAYYRKFNFDLHTYYQSSHEYYWIEGVGSNIGFYPYFAYFENFLFFCSFQQDAIEFTPSNWPGSSCSAGMEEDELFFSIYPNPAGTYVKIELYAPNDLQGCIRDTHGRRVKEFIVQDNITEIDLVDVEPGVYFLEVCGRQVKLLRN